MRVRRFALASLLLLVGRPVLADAASPDEDCRILTDKAYISIGTSVTSFDTEASIGFGTVLGSFIRVENDLELDDDQNSLRIDGIYAFNRKHALDVTFTDYSRDGQATIDEEIVIGDEGEEIVFEVGADIITRFDARNVKLFYKYSFVNTGRSQAGIGAGLSFFDFSLELSGEARLGDGSTAVSDVAEDILAPIPSFLMFIHHGFTPRLIFRATAGYFDLEIDDYEGGLIETRFTLDWFLSRRFAIGGGLEGSDIEFKSHGLDPLTVQVENRAFVFYVAGVF